MALPAAYSTISLLAIRDEFRQGASTPIYFGAYYVDGPNGYVLSSDTLPNSVPLNSARPTPISFHNFHGAAKASWPLSASLSATDVSGSCYNLGGSCTASTPSVTVTATGGSGGYTYTWEWVSGTLTITYISSTTNATVSWSRSCGWDTINEVGRGYNGYFRCKVTDSLGTVIYTSNVFVTVWNDAP